MKRGEWTFLDAMWRCAAATADACWTQAAGREAIARARDARLARSHWSAPAASRPSIAAPGRDSPTAPCVSRTCPRSTRRTSWRASTTGSPTRPLTRSGVERFVADRARIGEPFLGRYAIFSSSGTTGVPGLIVQDADALAVYDALGAVRMGALSPAWNWRSPLAGNRYALVAATEGHFAGVVGWERLRALHPWFAANACVIPVTAPLREICAALERFRPTVVASYATVLRALAHEKDAGRLALAPSVLWYGGEWLAPLSRDHIERAFGCRVAGDYGASEFPDIAFECAHGALHVNDDWAVLEPVDEHCRPVPPDTPSASVLLTNLANRVQPLVRYELGDSVTFVSKPCPCGSPLPVIRVDGRRDEILRLRDEPRPRGARAADGALHGDRGRRGRAPLPGRAGGAERDARAGGAARERARVRRALEGFLADRELSGVTVRIETGAIDAHPVSGKFRQVWRERARPGAGSAAPTASRRRAGDSRPARSAT